MAYYDRSCDSSLLFQNLKIAEAKSYEEHRNRYDVLHIDMNSFRNTENSVVNVQQAVIQELQEDYPECFTEATEHLALALARVNKKHGTKFVIIIDEWDALFRENKEDQEAQEEYIALLRSLFKDAPSKKFLKLA